MENRSKEEKPCSFYDPEQDRLHGQRQGTAPPVSPPSQPSGHSFRNPDLMHHETSYGVDSRGVGRGAYPPPQYTKQESGVNLPMPQEAPRNASYGRGSAPEPASYAGRGTAPSRPHTQPDQEFVGASGRGRGNGYGDGEAGSPNPRPVRPPQGASQGRGRGSSMPLGDGKYVYSGLQRPYEFEEDNGAPPAPISSEYAHEMYASVFSDSVYGGAVQFNARAGYSEEPTNLQELHHREDVLRHPDQS